MCTAVELSSIPPQSSTVKQKGRFAEWPAVLDTVGAQVNNFSHLYWASALPCFCGGRVQSVNKAAANRATANMTKEIE